MDWPLKLLKSMLFHTRQAPLGYDVLLVISTEYCGTPDGVVILKRRKSCSKVALSLLSTQKYRLTAAAGVFPGTETSCFRESASSLSPHKKAP